MGSTVLTGKRAAAFQKADGEWIYALFERSYESNCYPHKDEWSAVAFGNYATVMRRVFGGARSCEGGMLRARSGDIKPENYIESFRRELANPVILRDRRVHLSISDSFYAEIPQGKANDVRLKVIEAGFADRAEELAAGKLEVSLHADIDLLLSIYGYGGPVSAWRLLKESDCSGTQFSVPTPTSVKTAMDRMPQVRCHTLGQHSVLISMDSGPWRNAGWQYNAVGAFVEDVAYPVEMETPGFAKKAIPAFREALSAATALPNATRITVRRVGADKWALGRVDEVAQGLGLVEAEKSAPDVFSFTYGEVCERKDDQLMYRFCNLSEDQATWDVAEKQEGAAPSPADLNAADQMSLSLF